jgi:hypothetical protein
MPAYRIYWFDPNDHVTEVDWLIAEADDDVRHAATCASERLRPLRFGTRRAASGKQPGDLRGGALAAGSVATDSLNLCAIVTRAHGRNT